jgi:hypothetical protein
MGKELGKEIILYCAKFTPVYCENNSSTKREPQWVW